MSIYINKDELMRAIPSEEINARMAVAYMQGIEIIRCKDCVHCRKGFNLENEPYYYCYEWDSGVEEDGFCSDAESKVSV